LRSHVARIQEAMGEGEVHADMRALVETMLVIREELERKGASIQRLTSIIWGPKTESFAAVCWEAKQPDTNLTTNIEECHPGYPGRQPHAKPVEPDALVHH
jgi:hypothetical protein